MSPVRGGPGDPWDDHTDEDRDLFPDPPDFPRLTRSETLGCLACLALSIAVLVGTGALLGWLLL